VTDTGAVERHLDNFFFNAGFTESMATIAKVTGRGLIVAIYSVEVATRAVNDDDVMKNRVSKVSPYLINRSEVSKII
jgi:hypothetical protein